MALKLRPPQSERYDAEPDHDPNQGLRLGAARPDWDREDAARNPAGMVDEMGQAGGGPRRWIRGGFGVLALAGFVAVLWYAYEWGLGGGEAVDLPMVRAEAGPAKEKPSDPGGLQVPYQDQLVLNRSGGDASAPPIEQLLPQPEAPLAALGEIAPSYDEPVDDVPLEDQTALSVGETDGLQPAGEPPATDPVVQAPATESVVEPPAAPSAQAETGAAPSNEPPAADTQAAASQATQTQSAAAQATTPATQAPAAQAAGKFAVQLVSLKDRGAAEAEWRRLQGVFPRLLGDRSLLLQSADVAGVGTVYRLRAGPFASRNDAAKVCAQLKSKQQDCFVVSR